MRSTKITKDQNDILIKTIFKNRCLVNPAHTGTVIHEIVPRSQRPKSWMEPKNRVLLCNECHSQIHQEGAATWRVRLIQLRDKWLEQYA